MTVRGLRIICVSLSTLIFSIQFAYSQCQVSSINFLPKERLDYKVYYNWGVIWVDAGSAFFKTDTSHFGKDKVYHFTSVGKSLPKHNWFFKVQDTFQGFADFKNLQPYWFSRDVYEGGYKATEYYHYNYFRKKIYIESNKSKEGARKDSLNLPNCLWDVLTGIYFVRTVDYSKMQIGQKLPINMIIDGEIITNLYIKLLAREKMKDDKGNEYNCMKFSALLVKGSIFKGGEDVFVWVSDDQNKVPICIEAKILVGSIKVFLSGYVNLKFPLLTSNQLVKSKK